MIRYYSKNIFCDGDVSVSESVNIFCSRYRRGVRQKDGTGPAVHRWMKVAKHLSDEWEVLMNHDIARR